MRIFIATLGAIALMAVPARAQISPRAASSESRSPVLETPRAPVSIADLVVCDESYTCSQALGASQCEDPQPPLLCIGNAHDELYSDLRGCLCDVGGPCESVCGDNMCSGIDPDAWCKACAVTGAPSGCFDEFYACVADQPPPPPCTCTDLPLCGAGQVESGCNGDSVCDESTPVCDVCCDSIVACWPTSFCRATQPGDPPSAE